MPEKDPKKKKKTEEKKEKEKSKTEKQEPRYEEILPPLDFTSLFLPFYTQALIKLGQIEDPAAQKEESNIDLARRLIDLLDLLKDRTKGNLKPEEEKIFLNSLHQLKLVYMEKAKIIKL